MSIAIISLAHMTASFAIRYGNAGLIRSRRRTAVAFLFAAGEREGEGKGTFIILRETRNFSRATVERKTAAGFSKRAEQSASQSSSELSIRRFARLHRLLRRRLFIYFTRQSSKLQSVVPKKKNMNCRPCRASDDVKTQQI